MNNTAKSRWLTAGNVWIVAIFMTIVGFLGGVGYSAATVDRLIIEGTKAAWAAAEPDLIAHTAELRRATALKVERLTQAANACAKKKGAQLSKGLKTWKNIGDQLEALNQRAAGKKPGT